MKIEIKLDGETASIEDGKWDAPDQLLPAIKGISDRVFESPSVPNLDRARAVAVAQALGGKVITPEQPEADTDPATIH